LFSIIDIRENWCFWIKTSGQPLFLKSGFSPKYCTPLQRLHHIPNDHLSSSKLTTATHLLCQFTGYSVIIGVAILLLASAELLIKHTFKVFSILDCYSMKHCSGLKNLLKGI